jgi:uncharacterized protein (TIGR03663 family)
MSKKRRHSTAQTPPEHGAQSERPSQAEYKTSPGKSRAAQQREERLRAARLRAAQTSTVAPVKAEKSIISEPATPLSSEKFWQIASLLLLLGAALRLLLLGQGVYSHDEAIHANFSLNFLNYRYDPVYHGPVLYHLEALVFWLLGDSDFTARLVPALLGIGILGLALGARRYIGERATLWALGMLVISPVIVAYSRRLLHDSLVLLLTLGAVLCFARALGVSSTHKEGRRAWVGVAACLALLIATKANAFFIIAMLGSFWLITKLRALGGRAWQKPLPFWIPLAALFVVISFSILVKRDVPAQEKFFTVLCLAAVLAVWEWLRRTPEEIDSPTYSYWETDVDVKARRRFALRAGIASGWTAFGLLAFFYGSGFLWWQVPVEAVRNPSQWIEARQRSVSAIGSAIAGQGNWIPHGDGTLKSNVYLLDAPDWSDIVMAIPKMLEYWGGQQGKPRLPGPHDYYVVLLSLYELPIALAALGGIYLACRRRTPFTDLLLWWAITSFVLYSLANEKVPWLMTHIILPFAFLGGLALAKWFENVYVSTRTTANRNAQYVFGAACVLGAIYLLRGTIATSFERPGDRREPLFYAQPTEAFRDSLLGALERTRGDNRSIWVHADKVWPAIWYLRQGAPCMGSSTVQWGQWPDAAPLRFAVHVSPEDWAAKTVNDPVAQMQLQQLQSRFENWNSEKTDFIVWPRASWSALRPDRWATFWLARHCSTKNGMLSEWSHSPAVVTWPKQSAQQ